MEKPKISVCVPTMNVDPWWFRKTVESAHAGATEGHHEFLVFSNCHTRRTEDIIAELSEMGANVRLVGASPNNEGVAIAVNECAAAAAADFVGYTDDDRVFLPGWDKVLLDRWTGHEKDYLYLTSRAIEPTGTNPCMVAPHDFGRTEKTFDEAALLAFWERLPKQDVVSCAGPPFMSAWLWKQVGYMDAGYWPGFGTDPDLAIRVHCAGQAAGTRTIFVGLGGFGTYHGQCISTAKVRTDGASIAAHIRFKQKWGCTTREFAARINDGMPL